MAAVVGVATEGGVVLVKALSAPVVVTRSQRGHIVSVDAGRGSQP